MSPSRIASLALLTGAVVVFLHESWSVHPQLDDAYISYRYALNLVEGRGLVFNPGEYVEGYTNLLWTLLVAGGLALGWNANGVGHTLGVASGAALLAATWVYAGAGLAPRRAWIAALAPWIVLASTAFVVWTVSGMETPLFAATTTATLAALARGRPGLATLAAGLATLTRPEGAIAAAVVLAFHLSAHRGRGLRAWWLPAAYLLALALMTAFRTTYYGSPIPNTFYAKVGGIPATRGLAYLGHFLSAGAAWLLLPAVLAVVSDRRWWPGALYVALTTVYVVAIGGDVFGDSRFLVPALPPLAVLAVRGAERSFAVHRAAGVAVASLLPAAACWFVFGTLHPAALLGSDPSQRSRILDRVDRGNSNFERAGKRRADVLRGRGEAIRLVAAGAIGSFGFYSRLPVLDYLGIVDPVVARTTTRALHAAHPKPGHLRSDADYVFSREPDYILVPRREGQRRGPTPGAILDIWAHPALDAHYRWDDELRAYRRRGPAAEAR
ncbi:MAG: hypothetical protein OEM05_05065 [Myxococcales bacterium]|nr:hypothetical protein [Myxococcales bacterium]